MSLGERIINAIEVRRDRKRKSASGGANGDFYMHGGNELLYIVPVTIGSLAIDAGGYNGERTATMIARYGCRSEVFEPVPSYVDHCKRLFGRNTLVRVHATALGRLPTLKHFWGFFISKFAAINVRKIWPILGGSAWR